MTSSVPNFRPILIYRKRISKCDRGDYKLRQGDGLQIATVTNCDMMFWITKCDKLDYKVRQGLQSATRWITKWERDYKVQQDYKV